MFARRSSMEDDISSLLLLLSFGSTRETLVLLCPERRPWACQPGLHDAGWRLFRKGLRNLQRARRPARARWRPLVVVGATDLRGSAGGREGPPWPSCLAGVEGPGTTCKGDGQTRQGQLVHTHRHPVLTTTHSSNLPHIPRPVQFINLLNPQIKAILLNGYYHMGLIHIHKPRK